MADLISKVVRRQDRTDKPHSSSDPNTSKTHTNNGTTTGVAFQLSTQAKGDPMQTTITTRSKSRNDGGNIDDASSDSSSISGINFAVPENGIVKTVAVQVENGGHQKPYDFERGSTSSSTAKLHDEYEAYSSSHAR